MKLDPKTGKVIRGGASKRKEEEESGPSEHLYNYYVGSIKEILYGPACRKPRHKGSE